MQIKRIHIENFRSIQSLDFEPGAYCVLIGENNSGKSNILRALNLALGETWPTERNFSEEDFLNQDTSQDVVIQVFFSETIEATPNGYSVEIGGVELRCKAYRKRVKQKPTGTLTTDYLCVNASGKVLTYPREPLRKGQQYKGQWVPLRVSGDVRDRIPFIYVGVDRGYDRHTPTSRWSVLRRLLNEVNTEFLNDRSEIDVTAGGGTGDLLPGMDRRGSGGITGWSGSTSPRGDGELSGRSADVARTGRWPVVPCGSRPAAERGRYSLSRGAPYTSRG